MVHVKIMFAAVKTSSLIMLFKSPVFLLIIYLFYQLLRELKSPNIIVDCLFLSVSSVLLHVL